jgi:AraC-like DNA-binding protein
MLLRLEFLRDSLEKLMDPLSDVLSLLKLRSFGAGGFDMAGDWSIGFPEYQGVKCYAVISGEGWLAVEGVPEPVQLNAGDCFLLPRGLSFRVASDLDLPPILYTVPLRGRVGGIARWNGGGDFLLVGNHFALSGDVADLLLGMLPPIVHINSEADRAALRWIQDRLRLEMQEPQPGGFLAAQHLTSLILIQALRLHLAEASKGNVGWLFALTNRQLAAAIGAMHDEPGRRWTIEALAERAGMSRAVFALKFKQVVGTSPMDYLSRWRMRCAGDRLANSTEPLSVIARSLGYESESAFSTAFKRIMGCSPRQFSRRHSSSLADEGDDGDRMHDTDAIQAFQEECAPARAHQDGLA